MNIVSSVFTVLFEDPFWIGIYERRFNKKYEVCKIVFGAEPKDHEIYDFILKNWNNLKFSSSDEFKSVNQKRINPKRMKRKINKQLQNTGIGTKAQVALKEQYSQLKTERKIKLKKQREAEKERKFSLKQEKRKSKHKGR